MYGKHFGDAKKEIYFIKKWTLFTAVTVNIGHKKVFNKILEFYYLKTTLLLILGVLFNICFMKYFEFVYEKAEKMLF